MRTAITVSALAHALFWGLNALSARAPITNPAETAITVDIVSPDEIGEAAKPPIPEKANSPEASAPNGTTQSEALASNSPSSPPLRPLPSERRLGSLSKRPKQRAHERQRNQQPQPRRRPSRQRQALRPRRRRTSRSASRRPICLSSAAAGSTPR